MAKTVKCKACGNVVSVKAKSCPQCGEPAPKRTSIVTKLLLIIIILGTLPGLLVAIFGGDDTPAVPQKSEVQLVAEAKARREQMQAQLKSELENKRGVIVSDIKIMIADRKFEEAFGAANRFALIKDSEMMALATEARAKWNAVKEENLLAILKAVPASNYEANIKHYRELTKLAPDNPRYKEKLAHYGSKLAAKKQAAEKEKQTRLAKFGEAPVASSWDGTYRPVNNYLDKALKDPDSLKVEGCTKVYHTKNGWLVGCDYRARNSFGGMARESKWFTIRHNVVVNVEEANAYKP
ncbi:MAG: hypothetical protein WCX93_01160 [Burkholderiaceae bacterium]